MNGFALKGSTDRSLPVIVECPHAGLDVPAELASVLAHEKGAVRRDADLDVDRICADVPGAGAMLLVASISRFVTDLNRAPDDIDPLVFGPSHARKGAPRGAVWRVSTDGRPLLRRALTRAEVESRIATFHAPYHAALERTIAALRQKHDEVVILALHSMPSSGRSSESPLVVPRADVVPGTRGRTSADARFIDAVDLHFRDAGYTVRHDDPYRGGYTTGHYGRPTEGVHAIQIELNRALYLDESRCVSRDEDIARLRREIASLVRRLADMLAHR